MSFAPLLQGGASLTSPTTITVSYNTGATYVGGLSTMLKEIDGNGNYFNSNIREVTTWTVGGTDDSRTVVQFPKPAAITGKVVIVSATLKMYCSNLIGGGGPVSVHRIIRPGFNIATATWLRYNGVASWATPGGLGQGDGFSSSLDAGTPTLNAYNNYTSARMIADLQDGWNTQGYVTWIMKPTVEIGLSTKAINFRSHIDPVDTQRPLLEVTYYVDNGTTPSRELYRAFTIQKKRTSQPQEAVQIDWSNPLAQGLVVETGGHRYTGVRLMDGAVNQATNTSSGVSLAHGRYGKALKFNGTQASGAASFGNIARGGGYSQASWQVLFKHDGFNTENKIFAKWGTVNGSWLISTRNTGTGIQAWVVASGPSNSNLTYFSSDNSFDATGWNNAVFVWRGGTGLGGVSLFVNGVDKSSTLAVIGAGATTMLAGDSNVQIGVANDGNPMIGQVAVARMWKRALSLSEARILSLDPWCVLKPTKQFLPIAITGISRPNSDELVTGWSASQSGFTLYDMIDEGTVNDSDYIISANTTAPALFNWDNPMTPGVYVVNVRAERTGTIGSFRILLEDSYGNVVHTSDWQTLTQDLTTYPITVHLMVTATRIRIETAST